MPATLAPPESATAIPASDVRPGMRLRVLVPSGRVKRPTTLDVHAVEVTTYPCGSTVVGILGQISTGPHAIFPRSGEILVLARR
jgi:hypothetical protein